MPPTDKPNQTKRVVDFDELYPGRFIKAGSLQGKQVTLKIADVHVEYLEGDAGKKWKGVITFEKTEMQLVLNKTNGTCLKEMFGREVPKWIGRWVTLFPSEWNGEPCIRIWGSPELKEDRTIEVALPKRKPIKMVMHAVRRGGAAAAKPASKPELNVDDLDDDEAPHDAPNGHDPHTGEVYARDDHNPF